MVYPSVSFHDIEHVKNNVAYRRSAVGGNGKPDHTRLGRGNQSRGRNLNRARCLRSGASG